MGSAADGATDAPPHDIVAVAGAGTGSGKSTAAINLAVAFAAAGLRVELRDLDPAAAAWHALGGVDGTMTSELPISRSLPGRVVVGTGLATLAAGRASDAASAARPELVILDCPPRVDAITDAALALARIVLVPVDASPVAFRSLGEVAAALAGRDGAPVALRVALARVLPRRIDRWGVVEEITERYPGSLYVTTIPLRRAGAAARTGSRAPTLYAPTTRAAAAYSALATEVADDLRRMR